MFLYTNYNKSISKASVYDIAKAFRKTAQLSENVRDHAVFCDTNYSEITPSLLYTASAKANGYDSVEEFKQALKNEKITFQEILEDNLTDTFQLYEDKTLKGLIDSIISTADDFVNRKNNDYRLPFYGECFSFKFPKTVKRTVTEIHKLIRILNKYPKEPANDFLKLMNKSPKKPAINFNVKKPLSANPTESDMFWHKKIKPNESPVAKAKQIVNAKNTDSNL